MVTIFGVAEGEPETVGLDDQQTSSQAEDPLSKFFSNLKILAQENSLVLIVH